MLEIPVQVYDPLHEILFMFREKAHGLDQSSDHNHLSPDRELGGLLFNQFGHFSAQLGKLLELLNKKVDGFLTLGGVLNLVADADDFVDIFDPLDKIAAQIHN